MEFHPLRAFFSFLTFFVVYQVWIKPLPVGALFSGEMWAKWGWTFLVSVVTGLIFSFGKGLSSVKDLVGQLIISFLYATFIISGVYGTILGFLTLSAGIDQLDWFAAFWAQLFYYILTAAIIWIFIRLIGWSVGVQAGEAAEGAIHHVAKGGSHKGGSHKK